MFFLRRTALTAAVAMAAQCVFSAPSADTSDIFVAPMLGANWGQGSPMNDLTPRRSWYEAIPAMSRQRDYATINQLICISNMENINAVMINDGIPRPQRLKRLNEIAIQQMRILSQVDNRNLLK